MIDHVERARLILAAQEAALAMAIDNGDKVAARSARARANGLRAKYQRIAANARAHADKLAWNRAGA
jgi:hypothetical protein